MIYSSKGVSLGSVTKFGDQIFIVDYVSTTYLGENKVGYPRNQVEEKVLWSRKVEDLFEKYCIKNVSYI